MSGNLVKVRKKAQSQGKTGNLCSQGNLIVAPQKMLVTKLWCGGNTVTTVWSTVDKFSDRHITYLYFIRTVIHYLYVTFMENLD